MIPTLTDDELENFEERAGILQFDAGFSREEAEHRAMMLILALRGRNKLEQQVQRKTSDFTE